MDGLDRTLRTPSDLVAAGLVASGRLPELERVAARYAVAITPGLADLIDRDPDGPIARQFVPSGQELNQTPEELADPIGDEPHSPVEGIVHRYPDRVLLKAVHVCAVYCRFCFRRETVGPGKAEALSPGALARALDYIRDRPEIWEVILTGGDPLVLSPRRLGGIMRALAAIPHVKVVRFHTRVPIVDPARITPALLAAMEGALEDGSAVDAGDPSPAGEGRVEAKLRTGVGSARPGSPHPGSDSPTGPSPSGRDRETSGPTIWIVVHANHPDELTHQARAALARIARAGIPLLSQSVLLRGVNDDPATLERLFRGLVENRVKPYYLHHGDLAPGTSHFRTTLAEGQALMRGLRGRVSGLCQPEYVLDIPGGHGKAPVGPTYLAGMPDGPSVEDWRGTAHPYPPGMHP